MSYDISRIKTSMAPLVGWRQNRNPNEAQIEDSLKTSQSGLFYQDAHPLLTLDNLSSLAPDFSNYVYPIWLVGKSYVVGDIVKDGSVDFQATADNIGFQPSLNLAKWKVNNPFSDWLKEKTDSAIVQNIANWHEQKQIAKTARSLVENRWLFEGAGDMEDTSENKSQLVGHEIRLTRHLGVTTCLNRVSVQFTQSGNVTLSLYHSNKVSPLDSVVLDYTQGGSVQWFDLNWDLSFFDALVDVGGSYYITYEQSEVSGEAINKVQDWAADPRGRGIFVNKGWSQYIEFHPFRIDNFTSGQLWDIKDHDYDYSVNYGLNFQLSVFCDYTDFIIDQRDLFKNSQLYMVGKMLIGELFNNADSRINHDSATIDKNQLAIELELVDTQGRIGIVTKYRQSIEAIKLNTENMSKICLPCRRKGIRWARMS